MNVSIKNGYGLLYHLLNKTCVLLAIRLQCKPNELELHLFMAQFQRHQFILDATDWFDSGTEYHLFEERNLFFFSFNRTVGISIQAGTSPMWRDTNASEHEVQLLQRRRLQGRWMQCGAGQGWALGCKADKETRPLETLGSTPPLSSHMGPVLWSALLELGGYLWDSECPSAYSLPSSCWP